MILLLIALLTAIASMQLSLAFTCLMRFPSSRIAATLLLAAAPAPPLFALFGERWLTARHTPSSFDPLGDGFMILGQWIAGLIGLCTFCGMLCVAIAMRLARRSSSP